MFSFLLSIKLLNKINRIGLRFKNQALIYFNRNVKFQLQLLEKFNVGDEVSISMEIRPRNSTGLLLSVTGKKHYLVLELLDNEVVATVDNGHGPFRASYSLGNKFALCDGNWHKIHGELTPILSQNIDALAAASEEAFVGARCKVCTSTPLAFIQYISNSVTDQ